MAEVGHVTGQVGNGNQDEVGCCLHPSHPGSPDPHGTPGVSTRPAAPLPEAGHWGSGEKREQAVAADKLPAPGLGGPHAPLTPTLQSELRRPRGPPPPQPNRGAEAPEEQAGHQCPCPPAGRPGPTSSQRHPPSRCGAARHQESPPPSTRGAEIVPEPWCPACYASALPSPPP